MKEFLKYTLAAIVGFFVVNILVFFLFFGIMGAIISSQESETKLKANTVYQLDLKGVLEERYQDNPLSDLSFVPLFATESTIGLDDILSNIRKAKQNPNIIGIRLNCGYLSGGFASCKEIRDALIDFKESGKFIVAYGDSYTQKAYYIASVADKVILNPIGSVSFRGIASTITFYKNLLEKLEVEMQIVKVGEFKSAVEPWINTKMSEANREQVTVYINSIWNNLLKEISASRGISVEQLNAYADEALDFRRTEKALEYGFVDQLAYETDVKKIINEIRGEDEDKKLAVVKHSAMKRVLDNTKFNKTKVAVIYAVGGIDMGDDEGIVSTRLVKTINKVAEDDNVKAVVFRVNSGGGSAYGSEQIWYALTELKEKKPLIVSMGDYAASGGYYIACMGDQILAQPNTLTGSIGVFGQIPNLKGFFNDKLGLTFDVVKTNELSEGIVTYRGFNGEEREIMQNYVEDTYELFVKRCADGRNMTTDEIKKIAEGRVWSGENALEIGLVDKLGGLDDAVLLAAEAAGLDNYNVAAYPAKEDFFTRLLNKMSDEVQTRVLKNKLGEKYQVLKALESFENSNGVYARMPFDIEIN